MKLWRCGPPYTRRRRKALYHACTIPLLCFRLGRCVVSYSRSYSCSCSVLQRVSLMRTLRPCLTANLVSGEARARVCDEDGGAEPSTSAKDQVATKNECPMRTTTSRAAANHGRRRYSPRGDRLRRERQREVQHKVSRTYRSVRTGRGRSRRSAQVSGVHTEQGMVSSAAATHSADLRVYATRDRERF